MEETIEEKQKRRKEERKRRRDLKRLKKGNLIHVPGMNMKTFSQVFDSEVEFIENTFKCLPEVRCAHLFRNEEEILEKHLIDDDEISNNKRKKFLESLKNGGSQRAATHLELRQKLESKLEEIRKRREIKIINSNSKKNVKRKTVKMENGVNVEDDETNEVNTTVKTPVRNRPILKSNGEVVYSKFDFIKEGSRNGKKFQLKRKSDPAVILKSVEKKENKIETLVSKGNKLEAIKIAEEQKWDAALRRAEGEKVKDDPFLLKKSLKRKEKEKDLSRKKWKQRTEWTEKQQAEKQNKRLENIRARKEKKMKGLSKKKKK